MLEKRNDAKAAPGVKTAAGDASAIDDIVDFAEGCFSKAVTRDQGRGKKPDGRACRRKEAI